MAAKTTKYDRAIGYIKEKLKACPRMSGSPAGQSMLDSLCPGFYSGYESSRKTGERLCGYEVYVSGWPELKGVMVTCEETEYNADLRAVLFADSERALKDLLLSLPGGKAVALWASDRWMMAAVEELFEGCAIPFREGLSDRQESRLIWEGYSYLGIKRGSGSFRADLAGKEESFYRQSGVKLFEKKQDAHKAGLSITGKKDPLLTEFINLNSLKERMVRSRFVAEDLLLVKRALEDGLPVETLFYTPGLLKEEGGQELLKLALEKGVPCYKVSEGLMGAVTTTRPVPTAAVSVYTASRDAADFHLDEKSALLVVDSVSNPDNLGMVLRTADAGGVDAVVLIGEGAGPFHKNCIRSARGAVGRIPILNCRNEDQFFERLRQMSFTIIGSSAKADFPIYRLSLERPIAIIVGNENSGIRKSVLEKCTHTVRIPMHPGQSSLNVGVAAGILLYELARREGQS